jgi:AcrR family transcriptional regulator
MPGTQSEDTEARLGHSTDPRAMRTRQALRTAFLSLLNSEPLDQVTPQRIAKNAGVARASFYLHYASKEALLHDVAQETIGLLYENSQAVLDAMGSRIAALALCEQVEANRQLWTALLNGGASWAIREEILSRSRAIAAVRADPEDRLPSELSTSYSASAMVEILAWWLRQDEGYSAEFVADLIVEMVFNPVRAVSTSKSLKFS